jgi:hypothetical protein
VQGRPPQHDAGRPTNIDDGRASCLADLGRAPAGLDWGPQGDRLLVDAGLVVAADGAHPSGFVPGTGGITWSKPKGTAMIAPSPDGAQLRHVKLGDPNEIGIPGLALTDLAEFDSLPTELVASPTSARSPGHPTVRRPATGALSGAGSERVSAPQCRPGRTARR